MLPLQGDRGYHATSAGASCDESTCQPRPENFALAGCRSDRGLTERDKHRDERCRRRVRPRPLEDRKLKSRQNGQAAFRAENAKSGDNRARGKRRDRETSQGCGADTRKTGARVDDLPNQFSFAKRNERCVARNRMLAVQGQRQRRACNKFERFRGYPYHWLPPYQAPPRCPQRTLCKDHVQSSSVELLDQRRTHADLDVEFHIRM